MCVFRSFLFQWTDNVDDGQVQYAARAVVFHLGEKSESGAKIQGVQKGLGLHRKAFKLGNFLDEALKFKEALASSKMDPVERLLTLITRAAMVFFQMYDNILWGLEVKFFDKAQFDKNTVKMRAYQFRFVAAICQLVQIVLTVSKQQDVVEKIAADGGSADAKELQKAREKQGLNAWKLLKGVCDLITYGQSTEWLQYVTGKTLDDYAIGSIGALSSYAGVMEIWITKV